MKRDLLVIVLTGILGATSVHAALIATTDNFTIGGKNDDARSYTHTVDAAGAGDIIVMSGGLNGRLDQKHMTVAATGADVTLIGYLDNSGATTQGTATGSDGYGGYLWAYRVNTAFSGDALTLTATMNNNGTASFGGVVLRSSAGTVNLLDTAWLDSRVGLAGTTQTVSMAYDLGEYTSGYYIESADSPRDIVSFPATDSVLYDKGGSGATQRLGVSGFFSGTTLESEYEFRKDFNYDGMGVAGMAFVEAIPEPATASLILLMGGGVLFVRRRFVRG